MRKRSSRTILVVIPDSDSAERTVRYAAKQMRDGQELVVLDYDPVIPFAAMSEIVPQLKAFILVNEARYRVDDDEALEPIK